MVKLRKQRRKKVYRTNVNRKRMRNRIQSVGTIECKQVKKSWDEHKSIQRNLEDMGLVYDPNKNIKIPNVRQERKKELMAILSGSMEVENIAAENNKPSASKLHVAVELEQEAKAPRARMFRLPKGQVEWVTYLMDKYGEDYKAMSRDRKNYYQQTPKQLRAKIKTFMGIPEQYNEYLQQKIK